MHKKEARNELRCAKRNMSPDEIMSLARKFYQLVRAHSRCKKIHQRAAGLGTAKCARCERQQNFWPSSKKLLDDSSGSSVEPQFSKEEDIQFFY